MLNFQYYAPTKVVFGKGTEGKVGELVKKKDVRKSLYITADRVPKSPGFLTECLMH